MHALNYNRCKFGKIEAGRDEVINFILNLCSLTFSPNVYPACHSLALKRQHCFDVQDRSQHGAGRSEILNVANFLLSSASRPDHTYASEAKAAPFAS